MIRPRKASTKWNNCSKFVNLNEDHVIDYFEEVVANIFLEKENPQQKLDAYFKELVDEAHQRKVECLHDLKCQSFGHLI